MVFVGAVAAAEGLYGDVGVDSGGLAGGAILSWGGEGRLVAGAGPVFNWAAGVLWRMGAGLEVSIGIVGAMVGIWDCVVTAVFMYSWKCC